MVRGLGTQKAKEWLIWPPWTLMVTMANLVGWWLDSDALWAHSHLINQQIFTIQVYPQMLQMGMEWAFTTLHPWWWTCKIINITTPPWPWICKAGSPTCNRTWCVIDLLWYLLTQDTTKLIPNQVQGLRILIMLHTCTVMKPPVAVLSCRRLEVW